jgi:hypothetical protein
VRRGTPEKRAPPGVARGPWRLRLSLGECGAHLSLSRAPKLFSPRASGGAGAARPRGPAAERSPASRPSPERARGTTTAPRLNMPSVLPRRHSAGSSALLQFDLLFECGSAEEAAGALQSAASVGALGVSRPPLAPRGSGLKPPALRRRGEATEAASPEAAAAFARQLAAPRGGFEHAVAAAASSALEAAAASPPCDLPLSPGCEAAAATRLATALRAAGYDALAVGESSAGGPSASCSPAGIHRSMHRSRQPAWVVVDPAGARRCLAPCAAPRCAA